MADGGIQKKPGGANKPQDYSTASGKFVAGGSSAAESQVQNQSQQQQNPLKSNIASNSYYDNLSKDQQASIRIKLALLRLRNSQGVLNQDKYSAQRGDKKILTEDEVQKAIPDCITDDMVQRARANEFSYAYVDVNGMGHTNYGTSEFLTNEVAKKQWVPFGLITRAKLDQLEQKIKSTPGYYAADSGFSYCPPPSQVPYGMTYRGIHKEDHELLKKFYNSYVGAAEPDLLLSWGARGEAIYTSPDRSTASSYSQNSYDGYIIRMVVDRKNAKIATDSDVNRIQNHLMIHLDEIKQSVIDKFKGKLSDDECQKMGKLVANNIKYDPHFGTLVAGYDAIESGYFLVLNGRAIYTERESFDERFGS